MSQEIDATSGAEGQAPMQIKKTMIEEAVKEILEKCYGKPFFINKSGDYKYGVYVHVVFQLDLLIDEFNTIRKMLRKRGLKVLGVGAKMLIDDRARLYLEVVGGKDRYTIRGERK